MGTNDTARHTGKPEMTTENQRIAKTILDQMGGQNRIVAMTGARDFVAIDRGVQFSFPKGIAGINKVIIRLTPADLYDIEFGCVRKMRGGFALEYTRRALHDGIYAENLKRIFEKATGLFLSL
jgi:hypothetical protein